MGCIKITAVIITLAILGLAYVIYPSLPDHIEQHEDLKWVWITIRASFIWGELKYRLGLEGERWSFIRRTLKNLMVGDPDFSGLEVWNSEMDGVPVRIYKPNDIKGPLPCFIYLHGGSWSMLDPEVYDIPMSNISRGLQIIVVSVDYRLAPEFPFPYPFDDCLAVTKFILTEGSKFDIDSRRVGIGGDSAGGNIAAAIVLKLRDENHQPALKAHVSIYSVLQLCDFTLPVYQYRAQYDSNFKAQALHTTGLYLNLTEPQLDLFMYGNFSTPELKLLCQEHVDLKYLPKDMIFEGYERSDHVATEVTDDVRTISKIVSNPLISPLLVDDMSRLPTTLVLSVGWDILGDENQIYAGRLKEAGVKVTNVHMKESFHGCFNLYHKGFRSGVRALETVKKFLKETL